MVTTAAHAQVSINGMLGFRADVMDGTLDFGDGIHSLGRAHDHDARFGMTVGNGEGTAGAGLRSWVAAHGAEGGGQLHAWVWWQPMDGLRITAGRDPWRFYGQAQIVGWGFNANNSEDWLVGFGTAGAYHYGATQRGARLGRNAGFYAGFGGTGVSATFRPVEDLPLTLIAALPFADVDEFSATGHLVADTFLNAHVGVRYVFEGIGQLSFTWWGAPGHWGWASDGTAALRDPGNVNVGALSGTNQTNSSRAFLSFFFTGVPGIQVNLGLAYTLPFEILGHRADAEAGVAQGFDQRINFPMEIGLGFLYSAGPLRVAARVAATFAGNRDVLITEDGEVTGVENRAIPIQIGFNVHPRFDIGAVSLHLNAGVQFQAESGRQNAEGDWVDGINAGPAVFGWHANPYVMRMIAAPTRIFAGLHVESSGVTPEGESGPVVTWRIPVGIQFEW